MSLDRFFKGLFDTEPVSVISVTDFLVCLGVSLALGAIISLCYTYRTRYTKSFTVTLTLLPAAVCMVIMMVNGNVGAGVAVAGAFSLVRFRSVPGSAREICIIFLAMGAGIVVGMGYISYAALFTVIMCAVFMIFNRMDLGERRNSEKYKTVSVTIPEDLDYSGVFDGIFAEYTSDHELVRIKTTNMGSMFRLTYNVTLKDVDREKDMIDELRMRNGNLEISVSKQDTHNTEL